MTSVRTPTWEGEAAFRGVRARGVIDYVDARTGADKLAAGGFWVVVGEFEGAINAWRFAEVTRHDTQPEAPRASERWQGPPRAAWTSSLDRDSYIAGVEAIRADIRNGDVYQVNLCRVLSTPLPAAAAGPDAVALSHVLTRGNPSRFASRVSIPSTHAVPGAWVVSASPELYLHVDGDRVSSAPIKGTAAPGEAMLPKDEAENVMITDLIRNDLSHVAAPGSVRVPELLGLHAHPGLVHLQSTVTAQLAREYAWTPRMWPELFAGTFPPGSVSGAPKVAALEIIAREERVPRGPYCGTIGWIDADRQQAELAVGIRTFWWDDADGGVLRFGTGAGITWGSDAVAEWDETELKAARLIGLASMDTMAL